jgi:hypothetical protein
MSRLGGRIAPFVVAVGLMAAVADWTMAQPKAAVPDAAAQDASKKAAGQIYGQRYRESKTVAEKTALAAEIVEAADKLQSGSPDQYVLLKIAADLAAAAGDAPTALKAVEKIVEQFEVAEIVLTVETLLAAAATATTGSQHKAIGEAALAIADAAADAKQYELVLRLCESARLSAQRTRQFALVRQLTAKIEQLQQRQKAAQEYGAALEVLENDPTNPAANLAAGRYLCLVTGQWDLGVAMLALGTDPELKAAAVNELRGAASVAEQIAIGDAWWTVAQDRDADQRDAILLRAAHWYRRAQPHLAGDLASLRVKQRLAELETEAGEAAVPRAAVERVQVPHGAVLLMTFDPETFTAGDGKVYVADLSGFGNHGVVEGAVKPGTPGRAGAGLLLSGQNCIILPSLRAVLTQGLRQLSLSVWVQHAPNLRGHRFFFDVGDYAHRSLSLQSVDGNQFVFGLPESYGGVGLRAPEQIVANQWYHVAGVWNGAQQRIYVNGQLKGTVASQGLTLNADSVGSDAARIGSQAKSHNRSGRYFQGTIDEVAIFPRALSDEEIQTLYQFGLRGEPLVRTVRGRTVR